MTRRSPWPRHATIAPPEQASRIRCPAVVVSQTPSPRSTLGYSRSSSRGKTFVSSARIPARPDPSAATCGLRARRDRRLDETIQEAARHLPRVLREPTRLEQEGVGIDTLGIELVPVHAYPFVHDLRGHFGVELDAQASSDDIGLRTEVCLGDQGCSRRERERVEVPLEPWALGDQPGIAALHRNPPDLGPRRSKPLTAQHARQKLAAEAHAEDRHVAVDGFAKKPALTFEEGQRIVERGELR